VDSASGTPTQSEGVPEFPETLGSFSESGAGRTPGRTSCSEAQSLEAPGKHFFPRGPEEFGTEVPQIASEAI
jgi:hypothetical protein